MAISIPLIYFSDELQMYLQNRLTFIPKQSFIAAQLGAVPTPIVMFRIDEERADQDNGKRNVYLPYMVAREVFPSYVFPPYDKIQFNLTVDLRPKQVSVFTEAFPYLQAYGGVILELPTAFGKTLTSLALAAACGDRVLIVYPLIFLAKSWYNTLIKFTTCRSICIVEDHHSVTKWMALNGDKVPDVLICMVTRIDWIPNDIRKRYGTLIIDEAHCFATQLRLNALSMIEPEYILALTATAFRQDDLFATLIAMCAFSVTRPLDVPFTVTKFETNIQPPTKLNKMGKLDWNALCDWLVNCGARNIMICQIIEHLLKQPWYTSDGEAKPRKILVLTHRKKHVMILGEMLTDMKIAHATFYGNAESYDDEMVVIGTFKKMSVGYDEENASQNFNGIRFSTLILTMSLKDGGSLMQSIGRCLRLLWPSVVCICDKLPVFEKHWRAQKKCFAEMGATFLEC